MKLVIVSHEKFMSQVMNFGGLVIMLGSVYALLNA